MIHTIVKPATGIAYVKAWGLWSHLESVFNFTPERLTVISGPNDSGKSSLIRIIRWVFEGQPDGERFIWQLRDPVTKAVLKQSEEGKAEIGLDNGVIVTKTRRKGKTTYTISTIPEPFEKAEVPQEVKDALDLRTVVYSEYFKASLNFAYQLDPPFLLSETPAAGAKVLGRLAGTEVVDKAIAAITKKQSKANNDKAKAETDINKAVADLLPYIGVDDLKKQLEACEALVEKLDQDGNRADALLALREQYTNLVDTIGKYQGRIEALAVVPKLDQDLKDVEAAQKRYDVFLDLYSSYDSLAQIIADLGTKLDSYANLSQAAELLAAIVDAQVQYEDLVSYAADYSQHMTAAAYLGQQLAQLAKLPDAEVLIQEVETKQARRDALVAIDDDFHGWNSKAYQAGHDIKRLGDLTAIGKLLQGVEKSQARRGQLVDIFDNYTQYSQSYAQAAAIVEKCGDLGAAAKSLNKVSANLDRLAVLQVVTWEHDRAADRVTEAAKADAAAGIDLERAEAELAAAWEEVGGICPTCGTAVKIDHKHKGVEV